MRIFSELDGLKIENFVFRGLVLSALAAEAIIILFSLQTGSFDVFASYSLILVQLALGLYLLIKNRRSEINFSFAAFCFCLGLWTYEIFMLRQARLGPDLVFWGRQVFFGPVLNAYFFLYFSFVFPKKNIASFKWSKIFLFVPSLILLLLLSGPWVLREAYLTAAGPVPVFGAAYPLFAAYFLAYFFWGIINLIRKYRLAKGLEMLQIRYVFLGLCLTFIVSTGTNLILPALGETRFISFGPASTLLLLGFTVYAIVRHRLMSIEVVIQRGAVYGITTVLIMSLYALAVMVSEIYLRKIIGYTSLLVTALAALAIAVAYQPLVRSFQSLTDRLFFRGRYDYQKILRRISQEIAAVIKLEELTRLIVASFIDTMKVIEISFLLPEKEGEHFRSVPLAIQRYKRIEIDKNSPIIARLSAAKDILVRDEVEESAEVRDAMERLGIAVWVPIVSKDELIGIIALGSKLSGDIYSTEDLALLNTLANQTAVALDNARLYEEVVTMKNYSEEILQSMTNGVLTTDNRGRVVTFNQMGERISGRKAAGVIGKTCEEVWGGRGTVTLAVENTLKDRALLNHETGLSSPERGLVPVSLSSTLLRDSQGKKLGALITIHDLSELKELEDKIRRADKLTALATMAAGMAHEIKNPLSSMKVFAQLLPLKIDDPEYRKKLGEILPREIDRIDRIVESLLGFARSTAPTFEKVKIDDILEEDVKYFADQLKAAGVKLRKEYAVLPEIEVDRGQMSQVFSNLILNAIQAMPEGGELAITTAPGKRIENILQTIKVRVSDTGHGISAEMAKKLFDPFFTTKYGGTGLGLTITHSIVDGHKGLIDVESRIGQGTTFTVTLPVSQSIIK